ncbi:MAG: ATP-binding protein [Clostridiaceae bacterium]
MEENWMEVKPKVNEFSEFLEIASDFGDPLELVREAISNSYDAQATYVKIGFSVENINGYSKLIIEIEDNGVGMSYKTLEENFWALGNSASKEDKKKIGEKGHGTKIYLRSEFVYVITCHESGTYESECENPFNDLSAGKLHKPRIKTVTNKTRKGTYIRLEGYNNNERSKYLQDIVTDYIYWFTKLGSFEGEIEEHNTPDFVVLLKCLDVDEYEELKFGHRFAKQNDNIDELFHDYDANAIDHYVKKFSFTNQRLEERPEVKFDAIIYFEGNDAKQEYNPLLRKKKSNLKGYYKVADRYGIWLCKDFIPVQKVNDWISGFGMGSSSYTLLHGFINCQNLKLTANRGSIANTEPQILVELKKKLNEMLDEIDEYLYKKDINTLQKWQIEEKTIRVENAEFKQRKESIAKRKIITVKGITTLEPQNESELFGVFITICTLFPDEFEFEPLDYKTSQGIDIIARNRTKNKISDCEYWYIELKFLLGKNFNHSLSNIRWVICWDFDKNIKHDSIVNSIVENEERILKFNKDKAGNSLYYLDSSSTLTKIKVIRLKEFLEERLDLLFVKQ